MVKLIATEMDFRFIHMRFFFIKEKIGSKNGVLAMGYINRDRGIEFSVLDSADFDGRLEIANEKIDKRFSYSDLENQDIEPLKYEMVDENIYAEKINKIIEENKVSHGVKETRELDNLDDLRDRVNPDMVIVYVVKNNTPEAIPVLMEEVLDVKVKGIVLRNGITSGVKKGDRIEFQLGKSGVRKICIAYI